MILLIAYMSNGRKEYYGPFGTEGRAREYAKSITPVPASTEVETLIVPYSVVKAITWRNNDN